LSESEAVLWTLPAKSALHFRHCIDTKATKVLLDAIRIFVAFLLAGERILPTARVDEKIMAVAK